MGKIPWRKFSIYPTDLGCTLHEFTVSVLISYLFVPVWSTVLQIPKFRRAHLNLNKQTNLHLDFKLHT